MIQCCKFLSHLSLTPTAATAVENGIVVPPLDGEVQSPEKPDLIEVLLVLAREKKPILLFTGGVAILATIIVLSAAQDVHGNDDDSSASAEAVGVELNGRANWSDRRAQCEATLD